MEKPQPGGEIGPLAEMLREAERVLDAQVRAFERADDKSEAMLNLGLAILGGGLAIASFGAGALNGPPPPILLALLASGAALNFASMVFFVRASLGRLEQTDFRVGPSPEWIASRSVDAQWGLREHYLQSLRGLADSHVENLFNLVRAMGRRRRGLRTLLCAVAIYATALL